MNLHQCLGDLKKKVEALGEMFECPVCFERLSVNNVLLCAEGHHVCRQCRARMFHCPTCKRKFNGARNYLIESVIPKFQEIQASLIHLEINSSVLLATSTKKAEFSIIAEGNFPCGICNESLSYYDMIPHIEENHDEDFNDVGPVETNKYTSSWNLLHSPSTSYDEIFYIHNMGIFFIKVDISNRGNVYGYVEIVNNEYNARYFEYKFTMGNRHYCVSFDGQVKSSLYNYSKTNYLNISNLLWKEDDENLFQCTVTITYLE